MDSSQVRRVPILGYEDPPPRRNITFDAVTPRRPGRYDCLGVEGRTWFVIGRFIVVIYFMFLLQQWNDGQPRANNEQCKIRDTFFLVIPNLPRAMGDNFSVHVADIWILMQLIAFFAWLFITSPTPQLWVRRWFALWTWGYGLRTLVVGATFYYAPEFKDHQPFAPSNPFYGALLLLLQIRSSLADLMYSGHTMTWVLSARFVYFYGIGPIFKACYVAGAILGPILLIAVREHYSADVIVAVIVAWFIFNDFHLWYVRGYRERWLRLWEVEFKAPVRIVYPVKLIMADGTEMVVGAERAGQVELVGGHVTPEREAFMDISRGLYSDEPAGPSKIDDSV